MAKTISGRTYAVIQYGRAASFFNASDMPEYNENDLQVVDVTGNVPSVGDAWNGTTFSPYIPPPKTQTEINAEADRMIAKHTKDALPLMLDVLTKQASGADKTALGVFDAAVKLEKAKKV